MAIGDKSQPTKEQILEALRRVEDPKLHRDLVSLNMVKEVAIQGAHVSLTITLPIPARPLKSKIEQDVRAAVLSVPGVEEVVIKMEARVTLAGVKNIIAVASGKGGVGKTTLAVNLAVALAQLQTKVGLLDADIYGPNVPTMLGITHIPDVRGERIIPLRTHSLKVMSMGFLNPEDKPLIWRGPMLHGVLQQFLGQVDWGELDYLIIDLPPGTGDVQLTLIQSVSVAGAIVVTTPSVVALADVRKAIEMFHQVNVAILGVVENMSYFICPHCGQRSEIFSYGEGKTTAEKFQVPFLGEIPLDPQIRLYGDTGRPVVTLGEDTPQAKPFFEFARQVAARVSVTALSQQPTPLIQIR